jgi:hypothetical protein
MSHGAVAPRRRDFPFGNPRRVFSVFFLTIHMNQKQCVRLKSRPHIKSKIDKPAIV